MKKANSRRVGECAVDAADAVVQTVEPAHGLGEQHRAHARDDVDAVLAAQLDGPFGDGSRSAEPLNSQSLGSPSLAHSRTTSTAASVFTVTMPPSSTWPLRTERQSRARVGRRELFDSWRGLV